jgi:S-sulfo-L-cysteine synthase (3-phospho-L-serine-dependent)
MTSLDRMVLVECNGSYGSELARRAGALGFSVSVLAARPERYRELAQSGVSVVRCATGRLDAVLEAIVALGGKRRVAGILAGYELALPMACAAARALGLPGPAPAVAEDTLVKPRARALSNELVGNPVQFWLVDSPAGLRSIRPDHYPVVAKPSASGGSVGVAIAHTPEQLAAHIGRWLHAPDERGHPLTGPMLVERFVPGAEYSVELFHGRPLALVRKQLGGATGAVEVGHVVVPWELAPERGAIEPYLATLVERLDLGWGPAHVEIRLDDGVPHLVEINLRLAGDCIPELVELAVGVDPYAATLLAATGTEVDLVPACRRSAAIRFVTAPAAGTVTEVWGTADAASVPGVVRMTVNVGPGSAVRPAADSGDRLGYVIATADDDVAAADTAELAASKFGVAIRAHSPTADQARTSLTDPDRT